MPAPVDLACVVHCHSTYSDGTGTVGQIAAAAARAGADAVLLTDHDTLAARIRGEERWHGNVLVCVGVEISPRGGNHYLAFGLDELFPHEGRTPREVVAAVTEAGGFGFLAHPFSQGSPRFERASGMPWDDLDDPGFTGIELWSQVTDTLEGLRSVREAAAFVVAPERVLRAPPARNLREWDRLAARRPVVALGGIDAHQFGVRVAGRVPLRLMGYARSFRHLRTHVLVDRPPTGEARADRDALYAALRAGRCYLALDSLAPARGFRFAAVGPRGGVRAPMGAQTPADSGLALAAHVPRPAHLRLLRDGAVVAEAHGGELRAPAAEPGVHRIEAHLAGRAWIISNPIYVR